MVCMKDKGILSIYSASHVACAFERDINEKSTLFIQEKDAIARHAASLVQDGDCVFVDAGTTTEKMTDYLSVENATFAL